MLTMQQRINRVGKPLLFALALVPFGWLLWKGLADRLGANPIEAITRFTGDWTLRMLLLTLAVSPLRSLCGWTWVMRFRRMLGLFAFFYALLHFATYLVLDQFFAWEHIVDDIAERPYITIGFTSFVLLIPLAVTSTNTMMRRLGGKRWQRLHRLVYATAVGGVVHFLWLVKADLREPLIYAVILALLLGYRLLRGGANLFAPPPASHSQQRG